MWRVAFALFAVIASIGCSSGATTPRHTTTPGVPTTVVTAPTVDWEARTVSGASPSAADWTIAFCRGAAPLLCVRTAAGEAGVVELLAFPTSSLDAFKNLPDREALGRVARGNVRSVVADRTTTCPPGYRITSRQPHAATVGGRAGVTWEVHVAGRAGAVEREISYATRVGAKLYVIHAAGLDAGACLSRESEFTVAGLDAFAATLRDIVARIRLPAE